MSRKTRRVILIVAGVIVIVVAISYFFIVRVYRVPTNAMANTIMPGSKVAVSRVFGEIRRGDLVSFIYPKDASTTYVKRVIGMPGETIECKQASVVINGEALNEHRVFVERPSDHSMSPLKVVRDDAATTKGEWTVYFYADSEDPIQYADMLGATYGIKEPFRIPKKGDPVPEEIKNDPSLQKVYDANNDGLYDSDQYFFMGDNRDNSMDSRYWGTVPYNLITGKVVWIY